MSTGPPSHLTGPGGDAAAATTTAATTTVDSVASGTLTIPSVDSTGQASASKNKKTASKKRFIREIVVSTSDEEADTVKDCFWRDLDDGHSPQLLLQHGDLYSRVGC